MDDDINIAVQLESELATLTTLTSATRELQYTHLNDATNVDADNSFEASVDSSVTTSKTRAAAKIRAHYKSFRTLNEGFRVQQ